MYLAFFESKTLMIFHISYFSSKHLLPILLGTKALSIVWESVYAYILSSRPADNGQYHFAVNYMNIMHRIHGETASTIIWTSYYEWNAISFL